MLKTLFLILFFALLAGCAPATVAPTPAPTETIPAATATPAPPTPLPAPTTVPTAQADILYVDPGLDLGPISPLVYGTNHGPWAAVPASRLEDAYNLPVKVIRFPGGEWGDRNTLQSYQIDQFMDFCKRIGATANINPDPNVPSMFEPIHGSAFDLIGKGIDVRTVAGRLGHSGTAMLAKHYAVDRGDKEAAAAFG